MCEVYYFRKHSGSTFYFFPLTVSLSLFLQIVIRKHPICRSDEETETHTSGNVHEVKKQKSRRSTAPHTHKHISVFTSYTLFRRTEGYKAASLQLGLKHRDLSPLHWKPSLAKLAITLTIHETALSFHF